MDDEEIYDMERRPMKGIGDFHLRSALTAIDVEALQAGKGRWRELKAFRELQYKFPSRQIVAGDVSILLSKIFMQERVERDLGVDPLKESVIDLVKNEVKSMPLLFSKTDISFRALSTLSEMSCRTEYSRGKNLFIKLLLNVMAMTSERETFQTKGIKREGDLLYCRLGDIKLVVAGELFLEFTESSNVLTLYSLDMLRMICDKFTERDNILISTTLGSEVFPSVYPPPRLVRSVFHLLDHYLERKGNEGYKFLKTYEALITGIILRTRVSPFWKSSLFWESTIAEFDEEELMVAEELRRIINEDATSIHHMTQLAGLFRSWGHPVIDAKKGVEKVRRIGTQEKHIDEYTSEVAGWKLMEIIFLNYFKKMGFYPEHEIIEEGDGYIIDCLQKQTKLNLSSPEYFLRDWRFVLPNKTFDIPDSFNLSQIVSDTAISPTRTELREKFKSGKKGDDPQVRRGVLKWMKDGVLNCHDLLTHINDHPKGLKKKYRVIGLYQKEREMNPVARMFALMTLLMRSYIVVTEEMLSKNILPLIPGITMTYPLLKLTKEMIHLTMRQRKMQGDNVTFCINMDFEKWNLNMRKESTFYVFRVLGRLFGLENLYNRTYDIFKHSIIYLADGSYVLKINENMNLSEEDNNLAYTGHAGGFEGLRQKGWTIFTVSLISYVCGKLGVDWKLMGQGDNQVLLATIYSAHAKRFGLSSQHAIDEIKGKLNALRSELISVFNDVGLPLKPLETWVSDFYFSYGKFPIAEGLPCSMSLKRIARIFFFSNEDLMTLDNALGSISANAQAASMSDVHPIIPYFIAKWQQLYCVKLFKIFHPLLGGPLKLQDENPRFRLSNPSTGKVSEYSCCQNFKEDDIDLAMISVPKTLGGYNTLSIFKMIIRGFPDPQNEDYQWLCSIREGFSEFHQILQNFSYLILNPHINYEYLVQDPTGLNLLIPSNTTQVVKDMIHRTIDNLQFDSQFSVWFKQVLKTSERENVSEMIKKLTSPDVLNARFLHDIIGSTLYGYCDSISSKIDKTVTLSRIALEQEDVVLTLVKQERRFYEYFVWRANVRGPEYKEIECPSEYIRKMRSEGWKKEVQGVSVPFPLHYLSRDINETDRPDSYVVCTSDDISLVSNSFSLLHVGNSLPYLGSVTQEKLITTASKVTYGTEPLLARPVKLMRVIGWFIEENSHYAETILNCFKSVTDMNPDPFIFIPEDVKGSMEHRYSDFATKHGSLWMLLYGLATYLNLSTDFFAEYAKGSVNQTVHFQAVLCLLQFVGIGSLLAGRKMKQIRLYRSCKKCITLIDDSFTDMDEPIPEELIPSAPENPYLFLKASQINVIQKKKVLNLSAIKKVKLGDLRDSECYEAMCDWLALNIVSRIRAGEDRADEESLLDLSGVNRTVYLKIRPQDLMKRITFFLWMIHANSPKFSDVRSFPAWESVKPDVIRTLDRIPAVNFLLIGGYFFWEEGIRAISAYMKDFPVQYPLNASSICQCAKRYLLRYIINADEVSANQGAVIMLDQEKTNDPIIKKSFITQFLKRGTDCDLCLKEIIKLNLPLKEYISDAFLIRCQAGHSPVDMTMLYKMSKLVGVTAEVVGDRLPRYNIPEIQDSKYPKLSTDPFYRGEEIRISENKSIFDDFSSEDKSLNLQGANRGEYIELLFPLPTSGGYRAIDMASVGRLSKGSKVLILGDGHGTSSLMLRLCGFKGIVAQTYAQAPDGLPHAALKSKPPAHYAYSQLDIAITDYSLNSISDISNPLYYQTAERILQENQIDTLICDVEWWYIGEDYTCKMIEMFSKLRIWKMILKVSLSNTSIFIKILETANSFFEQVRVVQTYCIRATNNEVVMVMSYPRESPINVFVSPSSLALLSDEIRRGCEYFSGDVKIEMPQYIQENEERMFSSDHSRAVMFETIDNWFRAGNIADWADPDYSRMYYSLKTGRRPEGISDMIGNKIYYLRDDHEKKLLERLLCLLASMLSSWSERVSFISRSWKLTWNMKTESSNIHRPYLKWSISVEEDNSVVKDSRMKSEIMRRANIVKKFREERAKEQNKVCPEFMIVPERINFEYHSRERPTVVLHFPISKIASYSVVN